MLEIKKFTFAAPDDDGDMNMDLETEVVNQFEHEISYLKGAVTVIRPDGAVIGVGTNWDPVTIPPGGSDSFHPGHVWIKSTEAGTTNASDFSASVYVTPYRGEQVLSSELEYVGGTAPVSSSGELTLRGIAVPYSALIVSSPPDEEGSISIECRVCVVPSPEQTLQFLHLRVELVQPDGEVIDESDETADIDGTGVVLFTPGFWITTPSDLEGARVRLLLTDYMPLGRFTDNATGKSEVEEVEEETAPSDDTRRKAPRKKATRKKATRTSVDTGDSVASRLKAAFDQDGDLVIDSIIKDEDPYVELVITRTGMAGDDDYRVQLDRHVDGSDDYDLQLETGSCIEDIEQIVDAYVEGGGNADTLPG